MCMNKISISTNINSIEEFRACYEQELKEILEELSNNGVENIDGVEEVVKLFFDEYYQYLSIELASDREVYEEYQRTLYQLTEQEIYLRSFVDVISSEFYGDIYREIFNEIGILKGFVINNDNRHDWHTASNAKKYTNSEYLEHEERLKKETWNKCASHFRTWYLEKKLSRMHESLLGLRDERKRIIVSIIYNCHLKRLEDLLGICTQCNCLIDDNTNEIRKLKNETIRDLDMASLSAISYHLPSDLFDEFNTYIFDVLCDGVYLRTSDMNLTRTGR